MNRQFKFFAFLFLSTLIFSLSSFSQQYWVSPTGNDSTGDGSQTNPWQHINYAIQQIGVNNQVPQRILNVMPGVYSPSTTGEVFSIEMVGNLWLKGADSSNTILDAENTELAVRCWKTKGVKISDLQVTRGVAVGLYDPIGGISARDGAKVEITRCIIRDSQGGILSANNTPQYQDSGTYVYAHHNLIKKIHSDGNGITVTGGDLLCENNVFDSINSGLATGSAIARIGGAYRISHMKIRNNVIKNSISRGGAIYTGHSHAICEGNLIFNNLATGQFNGGGGGIFVHPAFNDTCLIRDNIIVGNISHTLGGGISALVDNTFSNTDCYIQRNIIAFNTASGKGGAIGIHNGSNIIVGGSYGEGNDIFDNVGADSINLFYHDSPANEQIMDFRYNYLGDHPSKIHASEPDSLFQIYPYTPNTMNVCGNTVNCDSLFRELGLITGIEPAQNHTITEVFKLYRNYPNPFNPKTFIKYELFKPAKVRLRIFNVLGKEVITLMNKQQRPGVYTLPWSGKDENGKEVSSGIYFYHLQIGNHTRVGKMVLTR